VSVVASLLHSLRFLVRSRAALHLEMTARRIVGLALVAIGMRGLKYGGGLPVLDIDRVVWLPDTVRVAFVAAERTTHLR